MGNFKARRLMDRSSGPATLLSDSCKIIGTLTGSGNFMIGGEFEGDCDVEGTVTLAPNGTWKGTIRAESVIVAGTVDGDIEATGNVEITNSARITGTVSGEAIAVAEGAVVQGAMKTAGRAAPVEFVEKRKNDKSTVTEPATAPE
jgi:cytoskeletal protein CcmA (bactofilin family)